MDFHTMQRAADLDDALAVVKHAGPFHNYSGCGDIWCGPHEGAADGHFENWALGRAVAHILQAICDHDLIKH